MDKHVALAMVVLAMSGCASNDFLPAEGKCPGMDAWFESRPETVQADQVESTPPANPQLAAELARAVAVDQAARTDMERALAADPAAQQAMQSSKEFARVQAVDRDGLALLRRMNAEQVTPTVAQIGTQGMQDFWLLVQHADEAPELQAAVLARIAPGDRSFQPDQVAMLDDRVAVRQGRPQVYGTQLDRETVEPVNGVVAPEQLEARRAAAGLMPMADYQCMAKEMMGK